MIEALALFALFFGLIRLVQLACRKPPKPRVTFRDFLLSPKPMVIPNVRVTSDQESVGDVLNPAAARVRIGGMSGSMSHAKGE